MKLRQIIAAVLTVACLCTFFGATASAETVTTYSLVGGIFPLYDIADNVYSEPEIAGTKAECVSRVGGVNTVKITVEQTLQKYSGWFWIWKGGTYRVKSVFTLTDNNGNTETITVYSSEQKVLEKG